jgi:aldehyde:ferredoxin oxidoreductase
MDKILRINMSTPGEPGIQIEGLGSYAGLGGRAMTSIVVASEVSPTCHPLGTENKLVIAPGLLSGSAATTSGRLSVGCKSPLTGGIKEANAGGQAAQVLGRLGYAAIILEGKPDNGGLYKVIISKQGVTIESAADLKGLGNYAAVDKLVDQHGQKVALITIGQAGEMKMCAASIAVTDIELRPTRHAARGGVGAVMGAKGIKAIVLDDHGCKMRKPADMEKFKAANKAFAEGLRKHDVTSQGLAAFGTNVMTNVVNEAGGYPTHNFQKGQFDGAAKISGEVLAALENERGGEGSATHGCHRGCIIRCSGTYYDKNGNYLTKQPEYETVWSHGGNCGIDDLDVIAQLDRMDDDFGLDTIEMGCAIGVAMDAGLAEFGDGQAAIRLLQQVGKGTPLGRILGNGAAVTGKVFGVERVPVVKGQAMPAYDPRAVQGIGVTYATSTMGADHTAGYAVGTNLLGVGGSVPALKPEGQVDLARNLQIATAAIDATGMCLFVAFPLLDQPETFDALVELIGAFIGQPMTGDSVTELGKMILKKEREFNQAAGFTAKHDRLPDYFKKAPLAPHNVTFAVEDEELDTLYNW